MNNFRKGISWGSYDFANSVYYIIFIGALFPIFQKNWFQIEEGEFAFYWGLTLGVAVLLSVLITFTVSVWLDRVSTGEYFSISKWFFLLPAVLSFAMPVAIALGGSWTLTLVLFGLVHGIYLSSLTYYSSSLVETGNTTDRTVISGWAWGWGYIGGLLGLAIIKVAAVVGWIPSEYSHQALTLGSAIYCVFAYFSVRSFANFEQFAETDNGQAEHTDTPEQNFKIKPNMLVMLFICMILVADGIAIFLGFMSLFWESKGLAGSDIVTLLLIMQLVAFPCAGLMSILASKKRGLTTIIFGLVWVVAAIVSINYTHFGGAFTAVILVALVIGASQSLLRVVFSTIVIPSKKLFGFSFFAIVEKGASFLGPVLAGVFIKAYGFEPILMFAAVLVLSGFVFLAVVDRKIQSDLA